MIAKVHRSGSGVILAVCDSDILGKKFWENGMQLDLDSEFYKGSEVSEDRVKVIIKAAAIMNFAGKKSVNLAVKEGLVDKKNVLKIKGIPHAQCVRI